MKNKIFLYAEGNFKLGLGNIYRSIALAKEILKEYSNSEVYFITSSDMYVLDLIRKSNISVIEFNEENRFGDIIAKYRPDILIIDNPNISDSLVKQIRSYVRKLIHIGNLTSANMFADVVVNAIIGTNYKNSIIVDEFKTKYLMGPKYLVLREEFYAKSNSYKYSGDLKRILLTFGGTDQANLTTKVLKKLNEIASNKDIYIIKGAGFNFEKELMKEVNNSKHNICILKNISNMSQIMLESDLIFTSPGTTLYEACMLKIPTISFCQNDEQKIMHKEYKFCFDTTEINDFKNFILEFYKEYNLYLDYINNFNFGLGKKEIIRECGLYEEIK